MIDVNRVVQSVVKSGRAFYGANQAMKAVKTGRVVALVLSNNCPKELRKNLEGYATLSSVPVLNYAGSNRDLGVACHKPFAISALVVREIPEAELALEVSESIEKPTEAQNQI
jgi:large subunit ribosomal protein L30e